MGLIDECFLQRRRNMADTKEKIAEGAGRAKAFTEKADDQTKAVAQTAGEKAKTAMSGVVEAVREKAQDVAAGASELVGKARDTAQEWASSVGDAAVQAKDKTQEVAAVTAERVSDVGQELTTFIRRYPLQSLLMGIGVGFLVAHGVRRS
jgi:ElaB/YqjD/DUF883 family membrane-anchored ribosome-binding protein